MIKKYHFLYTIILGHLDENNWSASSLEMVHGEISKETH